MLEKTVANDGEGCGDAGKDPLSGLCFSLYATYRWGGKWRDGAKD